MLAKTIKKRDYIGGGIGISGIIGLILLVI